MFCVPAVVLFQKNIRVQRFNGHVLQNSIRKRISRVLYTYQQISASLDKVFDKNDSIGCLVFPGVTEGIDWGMFKEKVVSKSKEPVEQIGLHFDTIVANKISDDMYSVNETSAKSWVMMNKNVMKHLKDKKNGAFKIHPRMKNMFLKFKEAGIKIHAYTAAKLIMTYSHECVSNILNAAGVKSN